MQDLDRALAEIGAIRSQIARSMEFRGYGPATLATTGTLAALAALAQASWVPDPVGDVAAYLALWIATACLAVAVVGFEMVTRSRRAHSSLAQAMIQSAVEQFLPAGAAGILLTVVIVTAAPDALWMLPGLWQIVFSLGVFAACSALPRPMFAVGVWYLAAGLGGLASASADHGLSPWAMGVPFGVGQLMAAILLRWSVRDGDGV
jgi:hypothetical protein